MDLDDQRQIQEIVDQKGQDNLVVMLGSSDPDGAEISAITVTTGDPTFAGPLAGVPLGLPVYHILESEVRSQIPEAVHAEQLAMMEMVLNVEAIETVLQRVRQEAGIEA